MANAEQLALLKAGNSRSRFLALVGKEVIINQTKLTEMQRTHGYGVSDAGNYSLAYPDDYLSADRDKIVSCTRRNISVK